MASFDLVWGVEAQTDDVSDSQTPAQISSEIDAQVAQNSADAQVVVDHAETADQVTQGIGQLQAAKDFVESQVAQGGMSEQTAQLAQIHVESICRFMRMPITSPIIPAAENFGSSGSKLQSSVLAVEGISDRLVKAWEALKAFFRRLYEGAKNAFSKVLNTGLLLERKLEALEKKLEDLKGSPGKEQIDIGDSLTLLGAASFKDAVDPTKGVLVLTNSIDVSMKMLEGVGAAVKQMIESRDLTAPPKAIMNDALKSELTNIYGIKKWKSEGQGLQGTTEVLPGGRVVKISLVGMKDKDSVASFTHEIVREDIKGMKNKIDPLNKDEMRDLLEVARSMFDSLKKLKETEKKFKTMSDGVEKTIDGIITIAKNGPNPGATKADKTEVRKSIDAGADSAKQLFSGIASLSLKICTLLPTMSGETIRGACGIVAKSMSTYSEKPAK